MTDLPKRGRFDEISALPSGFLLLKEFFFHANGHRPFVTTEMVIDYKRPPTNDHKQLPTTNDHQPATDAVVRHTFTS